MADPVIRQVHAPAMPQDLVPITFSTKTWLTIYAVLKNHQVNGNLQNMRAWAADHIMHEVLIAADFVEEDRDGNPTNPA